MKIWMVGEVEQHFHPALERVQKRLQGPLARGLARGLLTDALIELCYIPIVMGPDFADLYPAPSRFSAPESKAFHSPKLDARVFGSGQEDAMTTAFLGARCQPRRC